MLTYEYLLALLSSSFYFTVSTVSSEDVPRPAIVVSAGDTLNPFGFIEAVRDEVTLGDFKAEGEKGLRVPNWEMKSHIGARDLKCPSREE